MKCFLDLDGVLVNFVEAACQIHNKENPYTDPLCLGVWELDKLLKISAEEFWKPMDHDFWANLDWMPEGPDILNHCEKHFGRENICLLTSPTRNPESLSGKLAWIQTNLPKYARKYIMSPAKDFVGHPCAILIDDSDSNIEKYPGPKILIPRLWNSRFGTEVFPYLKTQLKEKGLK